MSATAFEVTTAPAFLRYYSGVRFHDFALDLDGSIASRRIHDTDDLEPHAVQVFADMLTANRSDFRKSIPVDSVRHIELDFISVGSTALATFYAAGELMMLSTLLVDVNQETQGTALGCFREILTELTAVVGLPPPELGDVSERPVVLSFPWPTNRPEDMAMITYLNACLAAAFFRVAY